MRYHRLMSHVCIGLTLLLLCCAAFFSVLSDLSSALWAYAAAVFLGAVSTFSQFRADNQEFDQSEPSHSKPDQTLPPTNRCCHRLHFI